MTDSEMTIEMPYGQRRLPVLRPCELRLLGERLRWTKLPLHAGFKMNLSALEDPMVLVPIVAQLYAAQKGLAPPDVKDGALGAWLREIFSHARYEPASDAWADFLVEAINRTDPGADGEASA